MHRTAVHFKYTASQSVNSESDLSLRGPESTVWCTMVPTSGSLHRPMLQFVSCFQGATGTGEGNEAEVDGHPWTPLRWTLVLAFRFGVHAISGSCFAFEFSNETVSCTFHTENSLLFGCTFVEDYEDRIESLRVRYRNYWLSNLDAWNLFSCERFDCNFEYSSARSIKGIRCNLDL